MPCGNVCATSIHAEALVAEYLSPENHRSYIHYSPGRVAGSASCGGTLVTTSSPRKDAFMSSLLLVALASLLAPAGVSAATAPRLPVRIHISTPAGEPIRDAYAALVPAWRSWGSPLAEGVAESGAITFRVPEGTYHIVCGAKGFQVGTEGPYSFIDDL